MIEIHDCNRQKNECCDDDLETFTRLLNVSFGFHEKHKLDEGELRADDRLEVNLPRKTAFT